MIAEVGVGECGGNLNRVVNESIGTVEMGIGRVAVPGFVVGWADGKDFVDGFAVGDGPCGW